MNANPLQGRPGEIRLNKAHIHAFCCGIIPGSGRVRFLIHNKNIKHYFVCESGISYLNSMAARWIEAVNNRAMFPEN
jgi:hypothetical protein